MQRPVNFLGAILWLLAAASSPRSLQAEDWPRLGGPAGRGCSSETGVARAWPDEGPAVLWSVAVGSGFAGPAVFDGRVYLLDREADRADVLRCFDLENGRELWREVTDAPGKLEYDGSRNVPTVTDDAIFTVGPFGHFRCYDRATHALRWSHHLVDDFKDPEIDRIEEPQTRADTLARAQLPRWGMTQAPLIVNDLVIVAPQTQRIGLVAFDRATGVIRWQSGYIGRNWYSHVSPTFMTLDGVPQVIMLAQPSDPEKSPAKAPPAIVSSVDPANGRILWTAQTPQPHKIPIAQPLQIGPDRLFITGGYTQGCLLLRVRRAAGEWQTEVLRSDNSVAGHIQAPVLYRDRVYVMSTRSQGADKSGLVCLAPDGNYLWQTGPELQFHDGPLLIVDGLALAMQGRIGELHLFDLATSPANLLAKARALAAKNRMAWAPMAFSRGRLFVRDDQDLKCLDLRRR
ncbi:MAG: PQQ-binding-like beta-propeller repeat protein [Verrucomicrobiales bacterium]|nr:PQQ-binding-like beta-propeller repeat protein [Verrucomicrobiales bacterium]